MDRYGGRGDIEDVEIRKTQNVTYTWSKVVGPILTAEGFDLSSEEMTGKM